jgi:hypothetical protein
MLTRESRRVFYGWQTLTRPESRAAAQAHAKLLELQAAAAADPPRAPPAPPPPPPFDPPPQPPQPPPPAPQQPQPQAPQRSPAEPLSGLPTSRPDFAHSPSTASLATAGESGTVTLQVGHRLQPCSQSLNLSIDFNPASTLFNPADNPARRARAGVQAATAVRWATSRWAQRAFRPEVPSCYTLGSWWAWNAGSRRVAYA